MLQCTSENPSEWAGFKSNCGATYLPVNNRVILLLTRCVVLLRNLVTEWTVPSTSNTSARKDFWTRVWCWTAHLEAFSFLSACTNPQWETAVTRCGRHPNSFFSKSAGSRRCGTRESYRGNVSNGLRSKVFSITQWKGGIPDARGAKSRTA